MRFTSWLWEQLDFEGPNTRVAKLCWDDVNNGCAHARFAAQDWLAHFEDKHRDKKDTLISLTLSAYASYLKEVRP